MNAKELIEKFGITLMGPGKIAVPNPQRLSQQERELIIRLKPQILEELEQATRRIERKNPKITGEDLIRVRWMDGDPLSGWSPASEEDREALESLGIGRQISGWGYYVPAEIVETLGSEFSYQQLQELTPKPKEEKSLIQRALEDAHATGQPVLVRKWVENCDRSVVGCSTDKVELWALPDGQIQERRTHAY